MKKFKLYYDNDAEQAWLNEMCAKGWALKRFFLGQYEFVPCEPGAFIYQVDLLPGEGLQAHDPEGYDQFMAEMGVEVVQHWGRWAILRKPSEEGPFEVYTGAQSQIALYRRIRQMYAWVLALIAACSMTVWLHIAEIPWLGLFGGFYIVMLAVFLYAILQRTRRIQALEAEE